MKKKNEMKKYIYNLSILLLIFVPVLAECDGSSPRGYPEEIVTFIIPISVGIFSQNAILRVRLWNDEQLEISEKNSACTVSYNVQTKTEEVRCPEGVKYQEVTPEEFMFPVQEINASIEVRSNTIRVGEKYRLLISGLSNDNCNSTSADVRDMANSETITMGKLPWCTTEMACP